MQLIFVYLHALKLAQFALEMCLAAENRQKPIKPPILEFRVTQGHWFRCQSKASVRLLISYY